MQIAGPPVALGPGGAADGLCGHTAQPGGTLRIPRSHERRELPQAGRPRRHELAVAQPLVDDAVGHRVGEDHVRSRLDCQVQVGLVGELRTSWIDDDEMSDATRRLFDPRADDWMAFRRVRAPHQDRVRARSSNELVAMPAPSVCLRAAALGAWQRRFPRTSRICSPRPW
jgi:hypothetical protein